GFPFSPSGPRHRPALGFEGGDHPMFVLALILAAAPPVPGPSAAEIAALVGRLGADDQTQREGATEALRRLGARAYPRWREGVESKDAELRRRPRQLIGPLVAQALARAADRHVVIRPKGSRSWKYGTVLRGDGKEVLVLTLGSAGVTCNAGAVI